MAEADARPSAYSWYVLGVLFLAYVLNFVDRQILSILAESLKQDLGISDEYLGFLYGTAFGLFYALFGIPLGRLADNWRRVRLMTMGLTLWSFMTIMSGFVRNGVQLGALRVGVGVGEACASPCAYSLISDYFPRRLRATAMSIYAAGLYIGGGCSLFIGGTILQRWNQAFPNDPPFGLAGWQVAFMAVGIPGLILALLIATLREPRRGQSEGSVSVTETRSPWSTLLADLTDIVPPFTLIGAARRGACALAANLAVAGLVIMIVAVLIHAGETPEQWIAIGFGAYAVFSWCVSLRQRDPPTFALIVGTPAFIATVLAYSLNTILAFAIGFWAAPYGIRELGLSPSTAGFAIGGLQAASGFLGTTIGGMTADKLHRRRPAGRLIMLISASVVPAPFIALAFTTNSLMVFYPALFCACAMLSSALGATMATTQDLVLPRMRSTAVAATLMGTTIFGLALGPYLAGRISTLSGSLSVGIISLLVTVPFGLLAALIAYRKIPHAEQTRDDRARAAGEGRAATT